MGSCCWIEVVYGIGYDFEIVKVFRVFIEKGMIKDYWILSLFGI